MMLLIIGITAAIEHYLSTSSGFAKTGSTGSPKAAKGRSSAAVEGARLAFRSRYLAAIVGLMAFYEISSQVIDFQFKSMAELIQGVEATQAFMANVSFFANLTAVIVQIFLVSLIMQRFGMVVTLLVMPVAMLSSSLTFLAIPGLLVASVLWVSDNGLNYSIQQTAREALYVIRSADEKYKARAFTNMFVQRAAKGIAILMAILLRSLTVPVQYLSFLTIPVVVLMILCSLYAARRFDRESQSETPVARV